MERGKRRKGGAKRKAARARRQGGEGGQVAPAVLWIKRAHGGGLIGGAHRGASPTLSRSNGIASHTPQHFCHTFVLHTYCVAGNYTYIRDCHTSRVNGYASSAQCDCQPWLDGLSRRPLVSPSPYLGFIVRRRLSLLALRPP